jgi:hypothetical protein
VLLLLLGMLGGGLRLSAQTLTQTIRGQVVDAETRYPIESVTVTVTLADGQVIGANTSEDGRYRLEEVPVGRQSLRFRRTGYLEVLRDNIDVSSAKEVILPVEMQESALEMEEVVIGASRTGEVTNEMATVSAREFSVTETNLYAGSRGEPARMASNYAGVQGADDSRNDIVIRGNSPAGLLYRLDGVNIPNPNHFAIPGTGGGPVTILNNKFLSNSDFFTGAFPAQYGNGLAGVFDLRMRNGNNQQHEFTGQLGFLGTELTAEGPLSRKSGASYLAMYRYSTLQLFQFLNINVGSDAVPQYQDGAFRLNFPLKNGASLAIWGIGGLSDIDIILSGQDAPPTEPDLYASDTDRDQYFGSNMGTAAMTYSHPVNASTFVKVGLAASYQSIDAFHEQIRRRTVQGPDGQDTYDYDATPLIPILDYNFAETKYSVFANVKKKLGRKHTLEAGVNFDWYDMRYTDSARVVIRDPDNPEALPDLAPWQTRWKTRVGAPLLQPYLQYKLNYQDRLTFTAGLTSLYWGLNDQSFSPIEPRLGLSYQLAPGHHLNFGTGLHSQIQSPYTYFYLGDTPQENPQPYNRDIGLSKSIHVVGGYDWVFGQAMRLKAEVYFQHLYDIPVETMPSAFSLANAGSGFSRFFPDTLTNAGIGRNYGVELTLERFFSSGFYFLMTGSLFDAQYQGSDQVWRNVTFNGRFAANLLAAYEFSFKNGMALQLGGKLTTAGGRWYGDPDSTLSVIRNDVVFIDETVNTRQFAPYFRADLKLALRWNRPKVTHEIAFDLVNVTNQFNVLSLKYTPENPAGAITQVPQLGFLPLFYYKIDF